MFGVVLFGKNLIDTFLKDFIKHKAYIVCHYCGLVHPLEPV